jgi:hypothetical protein
MLLFDANVLIALVDPLHTEHRRVRAWFNGLSGAAWATCPLVENAMVRIMGSGAYSGPISVAKAVELLRAIRSHPLHGWVADDVSLAEDAYIDVVKVQGHKQVTDAYLLALCRKHNLKLATLDRKLAKTLASGEPHLLELI